MPKTSDEWYSGAGGLGGPRDRVKTATAGGGGSGVGRGGSGVGGNISNSKPPGQMQPVMTPGKIMAPGSEGVGSTTGPASKKGLQGPLLFERTGSEEGAILAPGLKGRVLRGGGVAAVSEGNVSVSKVCLGRFHMCVFPLKTSSHRFLTPDWFIVPSKSLDWSLCAEETRMCSSLSIDTTSCWQRPLPLIYGYPRQALLSGLFTLFYAILRPQVNSIAKCGTHE